MVHLFLLMPFQILFRSGLGLTIWSEINYAVLHQAKELRFLHPLYLLVSTAQGAAAAKAVRGSEHSAVSSSSRSNEQHSEQQQQKQ